MGASNPPSCRAMVSLKLFSQQVEAISDLPRSWRTLMGRVRIKAIAIAVDNLDFRMLLEPICHSVCRTICWQIHYTAATCTRIVTGIP